MVRPSSSLSKQNINLYESLGTNNWDWGIFQSTNRVTGFVEINGKSADDINGDEEDSGLSSMTQTVNTQLSNNDSATSLADMSVSTVDDQSEGLKGEVKSEICKQTNFPMTGSHGADIIVQHVVNTSSKFVSSKRLEKKPAPNTALVQRLKGTKCHIAPIGPDFINDNGVRTNENFSEEFAVASSFSMAHEKVYSEDLSICNAIHSLMENHKGFETATFSMEDDYLDWVCQKVNKEEEYCRKLTFRLFDVGFSQNQSWSSMFSLNHVVGREGRIKSLPQNKVSGLKVSHFPKFKLNTGLVTSLDLIFPWNGLPAYNSEGSRYNLEHEDMLKRRQLARAMEKQWGRGDSIGSHTSEHTSPKNVSLLNRLLLTSSSWLDLSTDHKIHSNGGGDLLAVDIGKRSKSPDYTSCEFVHAVTRTSEPVDHRAVARMLEKRWGEMAV